MHYRFDTFVVNPATRLLQRESTQLNVSRRVFDCLAYLLEHRDRAIGRDELARALWKHTDVSDNQLAQVVAAVRRLLDDDGSLQRLVRTVPGFGYHWIGSVEVVSAADAEATDGAASGALRADAAAQVQEPAATAEGAAGVTVAPASVAPPAAAADAPGPAPAWRRRLLTPAALLLLALLVLVGVRQRAPVEDAPRAAPTAAKASPPQAWVLPAVLPDDAEAWARVGLMALVGEGLRRTGATVAPVEMVLGRFHDPVPDGQLPQLLAKLDTAMVIAPRVHQLGATWVVELSAVSKSEGSVRVDARDADLMAAARLAVSRLTQRLQLAGAALDGSNEESFDLIGQAIRARDYEGALMQLSRLPAQAREMPEAGILEIQLDLEQGRYRAARDKSEHWLERLDRSARPAAFARVLLRKAAAMRQLSEPDWAPLVDEALELLKNADAPRDLAMAMQFRGIAAIVAGRQADAARDLSRAREMFLALGDELRAARVASTMAQQAELQGRYMEAITLLEQSSQVLAAYDAVGSQLTNSNWTAFILIELARWDDVLRVTDEARPLLQAGGGASSYEHFTYLRVRTWALMELGRLQEAEALVDEQAHVIQREISDNASNDGSRVERADIAKQQARLRLMQGRWHEAAIAARHGLELIAKVSGEDASFMDRDDAEALLRLLIRAQAGAAPWSPQAPLPQLKPEELRLLHTAECDNGILARAYWNARHGKTDEAEADYRAALALKRSEHSPRVALAVTAAYVQFLLSRGRIQDASRQLDELEAQVPGMVDRDYEGALAVLRVRLAEGDRGRAQLAARRVIALSGEREPPADLRAVLESLTTPPAASAH